MATLLEKKNFFFQSLVRFPDLIWWHATLLILCWIVLVWCPCFHVMECSCFLTSPPCCAHTCTYTHVHTHISQAASSSTPHSSQHMTRYKLKVEQQKADAEKVQALQKVCTSTRVINHLKLPPSVYVHVCACVCYLYSLVNYHSILHDMHIYIIWS